MERNLFKNMRKVAREAVVECLKDGYDDYLYELHYNVFNSDCNYIYDHEAIKALEEDGVFEAIGAIVEYEKNNFGNVNTDFTNPCEVANMLWYIVGEEELADMFDGCDKFDELWDEQLTEEECQMLVDWLKDNDRI